MTIPYSAPYLLDLFNRLTGRKSAEAAIPDTTKYTWLSEAQNEVVSEIATIAPWVLYQKVGYGAMPTLATTDNQVFTFGLDSDSNPIMPFGKTQIYRNLSDIPDMPMIPDWDYLDEGTQIRLPRNRTYTGTLYWRGVVMPGVIDATHDPAFNPRPLNELVAIRAAKNFAESGNLRNAALADRMRLRWKERFPYWMLVLRKQFDRGGALTQWTMTDLAIPLR